MNTFKKFALVTVLTAGAAMPLAAQAANNNPDTPTTTATKAAAATATKKEAAKPLDFSALDKDHSGDVSLKEFESGVKGKKAKQEFASLDKNKDHKLSAEEFGATKVQ